MDSVTAQKSSYKQRIVRGSGGQIVVEYVLLLVVAVGLALMITTTVVSRNPDHLGFLIKKWGEIIKEIGADHADDVGS